MNIAEKYYWVMNHPKLSQNMCDAMIEITPHMVCPETDRVEKYHILNTKLQFWVEIGEPFDDEESNSVQYSHDYELDCGGDTWEAAVEAMYLTVLAKHGDYTEEDERIKRNQYLVKMGINPSNFHSFSLDELKAKMKSDYKNRRMLTPEELEDRRESLDELKKVKEVMQLRMTDSGVTFEQYLLFEDEMVAINHDIHMYELQLRHGYDVERYGFRDENHETDSYT